MAAPALGPWPFLCVPKGQSEVKAVGVMGRQDAGDGMGVGSVHVWQVSVCCARE